MKVENEFKSGLTWKSLCALIYSLFVFTPAALWLSLSAVGVSLQGVSLMTLLIFTEISALYNSPITKQEAAIIFGPASLVGSGLFLNFIFRAYFVQQPLLRLFKLDPSMIPSWWAPPYASACTILNMRTFLHPDWILPLIILTISHWIAFAGNLFFAFLGREIFIESERLPFPTVQITVGAIDAVATRAEDRLRIFSWTALIAFIYGFILYATPTITSLIGKKVEILPYPWIDLTRFVERMLPGGSFGIATDMLILTTGFIIPEPHVIGILIGSIARFLVVNPFLIKYPNIIKSDWATHWVSGMNFTQILQFSNLYFWISPLIGIGLAAGIAPIILRYKLFIHSIKAILNTRLSRSELEERISGPPFPLYSMVLLFLIGCVGAVILDLALIPSFPVWALILYEIVFPFIVLLASGRMIGSAGVTFDIPYLQNLTILLSGYENVDAWFLPLNLNSGTGWLGPFKICQMTKTSIKSWIKAQLIAWPLSLVAGFIYTQFFWQIAPIPSDLYPAPGISWPIQTQNMLAWITRQARFFQVDRIISSFGLFSGLFFLLNFVNVPVSAIGIAAGFATVLPNAITMFAGLIIGKLIARARGKSWFNKYRATIAAGAGVGEGIAIIIGVAFALVSRAAWAGRF